jgi:YbbR domain-containing protein
MKKKYHIVVASVLFAIIMWITINLGYEYTVTRQVPVVLKNLKQGMALTYPVPKSMTVRFRGHGWQLAMLYLTPDVQYHIDLSTITKEGFLITETDLPEHVKLPVAVTALDVKPETLLLALEPYKEKRVPVVPQLSLSYKEGFGPVGTVQIRPESITIAGAGSIIEPIESWHTVYLRYDDRRTPIDREVAIDDPESYSVEFRPRTVQVRLDIQPFAEKTITGIPIGTSSVPANREIMFVPPKLDLTIRGGIDQLAKLSAADFEATVDFNQLLADSATTVVPALRSPEGIRVLRRTPEVFQFYIRKRL